MKGIILAGGTGTRMYPLTIAISKQLLPVYDKPMVYYPLTTLINLGIKEILLISTEQDIPRFRQLLGDGSQLGCQISYQVQAEPKGLAEAYIIGEEFIGNDSVAMILGDNIFYGPAFEQKLVEALKDFSGGLILGQQVSDPERYGILELDTNGQPVSIEEKPKQPKSNYAIPGLYFFDHEVSSLAKQARPSERGEIEITEVQNAYLQKGALKVLLLDRGTAWLDTGTFASMSQASQFVQVIEERQGVKIGCIEEAAYRQDFIDKAQLTALAGQATNSGYGDYLLRVAA